MSSIRFIHTADLHLDSPFKGLNWLPANLFEKIRESTFLSFKRMIDLAIKENVDFIIISGDVYDGEDRSLVAQSRFKKEIEKLQIHGIEVFLIHGNHDHLAGSWAPLEWPNNLHTFSDEIDCKAFIKGDQIVHLYGFSYPQREVTENMAVYYKKKEGASLHIGLLHGQAAGNSEHKSYAPFTAKELETKDFDYWALGHVHQRQQISSNVFYPGNIQGRNRKEFGEKGCNIVSFVKGKPCVTFVQTAPVRWENVSINVSELDTVQQLISSMERTKEEYRYQAEGFFLTFYLEGSNKNDENFTNNDLLAELIDLLNEEEHLRESFVWTAGIENHVVSSWNKDSLFQEANFLGDIVRLTERYMEETEEVYLALQEIFEHPKGRKYVKSFSAEDYEELLREAENRLLTVLSKEEND